MYCKKDFPILRISKLTHFVYQIFELVTGRTPFGGILLTEPELISQLIGSIGPLPERWKARWEDMYKQGTSELAASPPHTADNFL